MTKKEESGKSTLIKGSLIYLWEEMKTMNRMKFKALMRIARGYFKMKFRDSKTTERNSNFSLSDR